MDKKNNNNGILPQNLDEDFLDYTPQAPSHSVADFDNVDNLLINEIYEAAKNGDEGILARNARELAKTVVQQRQYMTEMRIVLRRIAEITVQLEDEAEELEYESEKAGNRIAGRYGELTSRVKTTREITQFLRDILTPVANY